MTATASGRPPIWRDVRVLAWAFQIVVLGAVVAVVWFLYSTYQENVDIIRHWLAAKARNQSVVAPAAGDRAETNGPTIVIFDFEGQLYLVDRTGVVLESPDDRGVDNHPALSISCRHCDVEDFTKFLQPVFANRALLFVEYGLKPLEKILLSSIGATSQKGEDDLYVAIGKSRTFRKVSALVFATRPE